MAYQIINLKDIYNELGENNTKELLKEFSCPLNKDVEYFIKNRAIEFSKQDISRTYIVMSSYKQKNVIAGYFAITNKSTIIKKFILSKTKRKRLLRFANYDEDIKGYHIALPLIGQIGKNFYNNYNETITGDILLKFACNTRSVRLHCLQDSKRKTYPRDSGGMKRDNSFLQTIRMLGKGYFLITLIGVLSFSLLFLILWFM